MIPRQEAESFLDELIARADDERAARDLARQRVYLVPELRGLPVAEKVQIISQAKEQFRRGPWLWVMVTAWLLFVAFIWWHDSRAPAQSRVGMIWSIVPALVMAPTVTYLIRRNVRQLAIARRDH